MHPPVQPAGCQIARAPIRPAGSGASSCCRVGAPLGAPRVPRRLRLRPIRPVARYPKPGGRPHGPLAWTYLPPAGCQIGYCRDREPLCLLGLGPSGGQLGCRIGGKGGGEKEKGKSGERGESRRRGEERRGGKGGRPARLPAYGCRVGSDRSCRRRRRQGSQRARPPYAAPRIGRSVTLQPSLSIPPLHAAIGEHGNGESVSIQPS